jgi:predicted Fe-Mo cluster-binding NifX family protein
MGGELAEMRIVIPVSEDKGLDSRLSEHFGRAPFLATVDLDREGNIERINTISNTSQHFGGSGMRGQLILQQKPNVVITYGMGHRGLNLFQNARVAVLRADANTVREVMSSYNRGVLIELTEGCQEAKH